MQHTFINTKWLQYCHVKSINTVQIQKYNTITAAIITFQSYGLLKVNALSMTYGFSTNVTPLKGINKQDWNSAQLMGLLQNAELQNSGCILFERERLYCNDNAF